MSDGPYRSLDMRRSWKTVAKRAEQAAYATVEIAESALCAVAADWRLEVKASLVTAMKNVFTCRDNSLQIVEVALDQLERARPLAAASVFGINAIECSIQLAREGKFGMDAFHEAISMAVKSRTYAVARQIEEHYIRKNHPKEGRVLRERLGGAIASMNDCELGQTMVGKRKGRSAGLHKKAGLDDGVAF